MRRIKILLWLLFNAGCIFCNALAYSSDMEITNSSKRKIHSSFRLHNVSDNHFKYQQGYISSILKSSTKSGISGAVAGAVQVISLMWLRTAVNYQYR